MIVLEGFVQFPERTAPEHDWAAGPWVGGERLLERLESLPIRDYRVTVATGRVLAEATGVLWVAGGDADGAPEVRVECIAGARDCDVLEVLRTLDGQHVKLSVEEVAE